ncbi:hypothetical protein Glove_150g76 [Diversispora epigaea]|uniref:Uncharacterized protein n=1 Tax=Diversispora epigaea TaxID=1348612 RepID=A0A397J2E0_9GLOM|nr:hypothetical protein Glove_150g76 [Diversispora epigaea]
MCLAINPRVSILPTIFLRSVFQVLCSNCLFENQGIVISISRNRQVTSPTNQTSQNNFLLADNGYDNKH